MKDLFKRRATWMILELAHGIFWAFILIYLSSTFGKYELFKSIFLILIMVASIQITMLDSIKRNKIKQC